MLAISAYIHIPFCIHRCGYCDFNTYAGIESLIPAYVDAVCKEIELLSAGVPSQSIVHTIYFGGGTPSILTISDIDKILSTLHEKFSIDTNAEISLEANPGTLSLEYLRQLHILGVNRISIGMQSASSGELNLLDRQHTYKDVVNAVEWSRNAGICNVNLDLIYGLPGQSIISWMENINKALELEPEHLSLYSLTIEPNTPLYKKAQAGELFELDQDDVADMYEAASERLSNAGFVLYEISNWAKDVLIGKDYTCKHNLQYWRNEPYLGIGAGAHGFINHQRTINEMKPGSYIKRLTTVDHPDISGFTFPKTPASVHIELIDRETEIGETMMMGLRLTNAGVSNIAFQERFDMTLQQRFSPQISRLIKQGLLEWVGNEEFLRLTKRGRLLGNRVFSEFI